MIAMIFWIMVTITTRGNDDDDTGCSDNDAIGNNDNDDIIMG